MEIPFEIDTDALIFSAAPSMPIEELVDDVEVFFQEYSEKRDTPLDLENQGNLEHQG